MSDVKKASFSFKGFQIKNFSYSGSGSEVDSLSIDFDPTGTLSKKTGIFEIKLNFRAFVADGDQNRDIINVSMFSAFQFEENLSLAEIPPYFYRNSIAIVFPYLRAFISNLTLQANVKPVILPVLNLSKLEEPLRKNTIELE